MKKELKNKLKELEDKYDIKIIFAVESGSRSWGFASKDSDYDVRCVHVSRPKKYLAMDNPPEQITSLNEVKNYDIVSWDAKKFIRLFYKSNPSVKEWLDSEIIYIDSFYRQQLKDIFHKDFSNFALKKHYLSMCRQNYEKYIRHTNPCSLKKYVYVLRALACFQWLCDVETIPPIKYNDVAKALPKQFQEFFNEVVKMKKNGEDIKGQQNEEINREIEKYFSIEIEEDNNKFNIDKLNVILKNMITLQ